MTALIPKHVSGGNNEPAPSLASCEALTIRRGLPCIREFTGVSRLPCFAEADARRPLIANAGHGLERLIRSLGTTASIVKTLGDLPRTASARLLVVRKQ